LYHHGAFLKKLDIFAMPLIFAFFSLSTPCDAFDLFFLLLLSPPLSLSLLLDLEVLGLATASVAVSSHSS
jgi:hypothetical protein